MVIRVHNRTADCRSDTHVTFSTSFTDVNQVVFTISNYTNCCAQLMAKEGKYATLRLPSGEMRMVPIICRATVGVDRKSVV